MAGHSQFANIKHRKNAQDAKRAKLFTKLVREVLVAAAQGLPEPENNPRLRYALQNARRAGVPKDRLAAAIQKGAGETGAGADWSEMRYEGYAPGGVAVMVEALTDNKNRTAAEVRSAFTKAGGNLGETGSVAFLFDHIGVFAYDASACKEEAAFEAAIECGADNMEAEDGKYVFTCSADEFIAVRDALSEKLGEYESADMVWAPQNPIAVDKEQAEKIAKLVDMLDESDDVQNVYAAYEYTDE
ncbi:MAG: YebC/PmpR family DNA-binding transcriptional regulator [Rickettsiales bacterium]